ncbi:hypothetical protein EVA_13951 [gut metagenome]|uniref:Uncharacterized protein n=1 Tax=gut metagenome TaxID=749906 RepID=J9FTU9_9ZZZZ
MYTFPLHRFIIDQGFDNQTLQFRLLTVQPVHRLSPFITLPANPTDAVQTVEQRNGKRGKDIFPPVVTKLLPKVCCPRYPQILVIAGRNTCPHRQGREQSSPSRTKGIPCRLYLEFRLLQLRMKASRLLVKYISRRRYSPRSLH